MNNSGNPDSIRVGYIHPELSLTLPEINQIREDNMHSLLDREKLHLVLDLDHTLVHARKTMKLNSKDKETIESMEDLYNFTLSGNEYVVKLRPGVREFLDEVSSMFDLSVYTMGTREYAHKVMECLGGFSKFSWVITREDCVKEKQKGFNVVLSHKHMSLIADDTKDIWEGYCKGNLLQIVRYNFFPIKKEAKDRDNELARVLNILREVHSTYYNSDEYGRKDVKEVLKSVLMKSSNVDILSEGRGKLGCLGQYPNRFDLSPVQPVSGPANIPSREQDDGRAVSCRAKRLRIKINGVN